MSLTGKNKLFSRYFKATNQARHRRHYSNVQFPEAGRPEGPLAEVYINEMQTPSPLNIHFFFLGMVLNL